MKFQDLERDKIHTIETGPDEDGDYYQVFLVLNGHVLVHYGDYYHDKGSDKAGGFIDAYTMLANAVKEGGRHWLIVGENDGCLDGEEFLKQVKDSELI